jgi:hypothetical protein
MSISEAGASSSTSESATATPASAAASKSAAKAKKNVAAKPEAKKSNGVAAATPAKDKAKTSAPAKSASKPAVKAAPGGATKAAAPKAAKEKKLKMVRDSISIPKAEYLALEAMKLRAVKLTTPVKKTELIRAGIKALAALPDAAFVAAIRAVPSLKTGRPAKAA